jgi:long-chain-fatty-acid--CoA ligase ACSBG
VHFARVYDLKAGSVKDRLCAIKPTLFLGVPLVWEKIADKMRAIGAQTTGIKKSLATWAKDLGLQHAQNAQLGQGGGAPFGYGMANSLVLSKVKAGLGLDELKYGMTGAAPIRVDTLEYFGQLGIGINEVYGMSECSGASTFSTPQAHVWGSCGYEMPGVELKAFLVDPTDINKKTECPRAPTLGTTDERFMGELCWRSRGNMMGYLANPDFGEAHVEEIRKKTAESIDKDGWLHSGDKGLVTTAGMVKITGRYKELIIGEGGENIAPVPIEDHVKKMCDGVCEVMMVGDKRKYNVCLVTLKAVGANGEVPGTDALDAGAKRVNKDVQTISGAIDDPVWIAAVQAAIQSANDSKMCVNNAFKIQKFTILPTNFSEEGNELTPTKKLKRKVVETKYQKAIDALYAGKGVYIKYSA